jgi:general secretion pathway protein E
MNDHDVLAPPLTDPSAPGFADRFAAFLRNRKSVPEQSLNRAMRAMRDTGERIDVVLTRLGLLSDNDLARLTAAYLDLPLLKSSDLPDAPLSLAGIDPDYLKRTGFLPLRDEGEHLLVATANPFQPEAVSALSYQIGKPVHLAIVTSAEIVRAFDNLYQLHTGGLVAAPQEPTADRANEDDVRRLTDLASEAPVVQLVHAIIARAVEAKASDIHIEASENGLQVRTRIDGLLEIPEVLAPHLSAAVVSRIKIMARLNIAEHRLPQDGRARVNVRGREIELRISTMPTVKGESVVLRILDRSTVILDFDALGFRGPMLDRFLNLIDQPNGLILVTGPTGSGKSTTLYAALNRLNQPFRKTFTIEDPVETQLAGVSQVQVQPAIGLTFAAALRSILRQDPDVIMVGEIRDLETAQMAIQSALTGHLVLATLHTNSAAATIARLVDMGVEDYLIASTLKGTLAQRLVRRLCPDCAQPATPSPALRACVESLPDWEKPATQGWHDLREPVGCPACRNTGFRGRIAVGELLTVDESVMSAIVGRGGERSVAAAATNAGMRSMLADGLDKVLAGQTTFDEVLRVARAV